jgi:hypothetical protein
MPQSQFTRRQLLKTILAAGGGLSASALLPAKWLKPVMKSGVLPAHAQTSINNGSIQGTLTQDDIGVDGWDVELYQGMTLVTGRKVARPVPVEPSKAGPLLATDTTKNGGRYSFWNLAPGYYSLYCPYQSPNWHFNNEVKAGEITIVNFSYISP